MNPLMILFITGLIGVLAIAGFLRPKQVLLLAVVSVVFFPQGAIERYYVMESIIGSIFLITILGVAANAALQKMRGPLPGGTDRRIYMAFCTVLVINLYISSTQGTDWGSSLTKIIPFWGFIIFVKLFYIVISNDSRYVERIYKAFALSGAINILLILIAAYDNPGRATSLMDHTLMLPLPIIAASMAFDHYLQAKRVSLRWLTLFSLALFAILMTGTRGLFLAVLVATLLIAVVRKSSFDLMKFIALVPMLAVAVWMGSSFFERIFSVDARDTLSTRYDEIGAAVAAFWSNPVFGHGIGYKYISDSIELRLLEGSDYIHNMTFFIFTSFGISGLPILAAYAWYPVRFVLKHRAERDLFVAMSASGIGVLVYSLTQAIFFTLSYNLYMAFIMAVCIKIAYENARDGQCGANTNCAEAQISCCATETR